MTLIISLQPHCPHTAEGSYQCSAVWSDKLWSLGQSDYCSVGVFEACGDGRRAGTIIYILCDDDVCVVSSVNTHSIPLVRDAGITVV